MKIYAVFGIPDDALAEVSSHAVERLLFKRLFAAAPRSPMGEGTVGVKLLEWPTETGCRSAACACWKRLSRHIRPSTGAPEAAHKLIDYIYAKEPGKLFQELGGLGITVLALAAAAGLSADDAETTELNRVLSKPLAWFHARNKAKNDAGFDATAYPAPPSLQGNGK
jgi:hypothetical protein